MNLANRVSAETAVSLASALDAIGVTVFITDADGICSYANRHGWKVMNALGYREPLGRHMHDLLHASTQTPHSHEGCQVTRALQRDADTHIGRLRVPTEDGPDSLIEYRAYPIKENGACTGLTIVGTDVTAFSKAQEENLFHKVLLRAQSEASIDGILVVSADTKMLSFNRRFVELWGVPRDVVESRSDEAALGWVLQKLKDPKQFIDKVEHLYAHPEETSRDLIELKDGRSFDRYSAPVRDEDGAYYGRVWFFRDITDRVDAERRLMESIHDAEEALRVRNEFMSVAAHELKTPLTSLQLHAQSILRKSVRVEHTVSPASWLSERMTKLVRQIKRLSQVVDHMLDVTRIRSGKMILELRTTNLRILVDDIVTRFEAEAEVSGCDLHLFCRESEIVGEWDESALDQVVTNLVSNAVKYGAGHPVDITLRSTPDEAILEVRDYGVGIAKDAQARIFDRFERAVTKEEFSGMGVGLWIANQITLAHGGNIRVDSTPGEGSTFTVCLPKYSSEKRIDHDGEGAVTAGADHRRQSRHSGLCL